MAFKSIKENLKISNGSRGGQQMFWIAFQLAFNGFSIDAQRYGIYWRFSNKIIIGVFIVFVCFSLAIFDKEDNLSFIIIEVTNNKRVTDLWCL